MVVVNVSDTKVFETIEAPKGRATGVFAVERLESLSMLEEAPTLPMRTISRLVHWTCISSKQAWTLEATWNSQSLLGLWLTSPSSG